jgi:hypothetical protein
MSTHFNHGSPYENNHRAAELQDLAAHVHSTGAEHPGQQDHLTGPEAARLAMEHSQMMNVHTEEEPARPTTDHGVLTFGHNDIAALAYQLWLERGSPEGSPEEDWTRAVAQLRSRK